MVNKERLLTKVYKEEHNPLFIGLPGLRKQYVEGMANQILLELSQRGSCWLIEESLKRGYINSYDWEAVCIACSQGLGILVTPQISGAGYAEPIPLNQKMVKLLQELRAGSTARREKENAAAAPHPDGTVEEQKAELQRLEEQKRALQRQVEVLRTEQQDCNIEIAHLRTEKVNLEKQLQDLREQTKGQAQKIRDSAHEEARQILVQAKAEAAGIRQSVIYAAAEELAEPVLPVNTSDITKDALESEVHRMENRMRDEMTSWREQMESMMIRFRTGLYTTKYTAVCDAYQKLSLLAYRIMENRISGIQESNMAPEARETVVSELRSIQGLLLKRISRLERGLEAMGLTIIRPVQGSAYDCNEHVAENAEDDGTLSGTVQQCTCPGVRDETQVFSPASVIVAEKDTKDVPRS